MSEKVNYYYEIMEALNIKQMVLQGPPGTSKTYTAKEIVKEIVKNEIVKNVINEKEINNSGRCRIVQFHPSYCYEDFVRGITVSTRRNNVVYKTVNKVFGEMCELAAKDLGNSYFLIIDEINRADLAAVFGELIYALEYRGESVSIPYEIYGNSTLTVPNNLYIIGTMNTADRSVGTLDYAIRRRFLFFDLMPDENILASYCEKAKEWFAAINGHKMPADQKNDKKMGDEEKKEYEKKEKGFIGLTINTDYRSEDFKIGHTYFMVNDNGDLANRLRYQVLPILREYAIDGILQQKEEADGFFNGVIRQYIFNGKPLTLTDNELIDAIKRKNQS